MNTKTTMTDFLESTAKIMAEIRTRACIDDVDAEAIEKILKDALVEYYHEAYDAGHSDGYDDGYENGYADCNAQKSY